MLVIAQFLFTLPTHNKRTFFITFPFTKVFYDLGIPVEQCEPLGHKMVHLSCRMRNTMTVIDTKRGRKVNSFNH